MKKFKLFMLAFAMMFVALIGVNAKEVSTLDDLKNCLSGEKGECVLKEDLKVDAQLEVNDEIVLDLNGHTISTESDFSITSGIIMVHWGAKLTVNDSVGEGKITTEGNEGVFAAIALTKKNVGDSSKTASLIINGGKIVGTYYAVTGNGTRDNTYIEVNDGELSAWYEDPEEGPDNCGIFNPQAGKVIINGGTIKGVTGIEMRSGELEVNGGTIIGDFDDIISVPNKSGTTTRGAGIAITQHTTGKNLKVEVNGGEIYGYVALYQRNIQNNSEEALSKITIDIKNGYFEAINEGTEVVKSENLKHFISGGAFSLDFKEGTEYIAEGLVSKDLGDFFNVMENVVLYDETSPEETPVVIFSEEPLPIDYTLIVKEADKETTEGAEKKVEEKFKSDKKVKDTKLLALYDITLKDAAGIVEEPGKYLVYIQIPEELAKYDHYKVLYFDADGEIKEVIDAEIASEFLEMEVDVENILAFETTHFSTYGVIGYNDAKEENPNTGDHLVLYIVLGLLSLAVTAVAVKKFAKNN